MGVLINTHTRSPKQKLKHYILCNCFNAWC